MPLDGFVKTYATRIRETGDIGPWAVSKVIESYEHLAPTLLRNRFLLAVHYLYLSHQQAATLGGYDWHTAEEWEVGL